VAAVEAAAVAAAAAAAAGDAGMVAEAASAAAIAVSVSSSSSSSSNSGGGGGRRSRSGSRDGTFDGAGFPPGTVQKDREKEKRGGFMTGIVGLGRRLSMLGTAATSPAAALTPPPAAATATATATAAAATAATAAAASASMGAGAKRSSPPACAREVAHQLPPSQYFVLVPPGIPIDAPLC
jgi:hypothetical protein